MHVRIHVGNSELGRFGDTSSLPECCSLVVSRFSSNSDPLKSALLTEKALIPLSYDVYGIDAAQPDYSYPGNPAGLIRVDTILGSAYPSALVFSSPLTERTLISPSFRYFCSIAHIYAKAFKWGAVVFGAIPSLHAATSICCGLYATRYSKGYRGLTFMWIYCFWMFWATQYLHHHVRLTVLFLESSSLGMC